MVAHESEVVFLEKTFIVDKNDESRRPAFDLTDKPDFKMFVLVLGELFNFLELVKPIVEEACADSDVPFFVDVDDGVQQVLDSLVFLGTYLNNFSPPNRAQITVELSV